jgi:hypothetical protein
MMTYLRFPLLLSCILASPAALAADRVVTLMTPGPVRGAIAAMPQIANPADDAERRINAALQRLDVNVLKAAGACKGGDWTRVVEAPMRGPGFLSLVITDSYACDGAAHPDAATASIVYNLAAGKPADWARFLPASLTGKQVLSEEGGSNFVTLSSKRLFDLYLAGYTDGGATGEDLAQCKQAIRDSGDPPPANVWLDAKSGSLAIEIELAHAVAACEDVVLVPASRLRGEGVQPALLKALAAAHQG